MLLRELHRHQISPHRLQEVARRLGKNPALSAKLADLAMEKFGRINLVAPAAGIIRDGLMVAPDRETGKVTKKMSLANFQAVIDINLTGVFLTVRECAARMIDHGCRGLICLFSSTGSLELRGR